MSEWKVATSRKPKARGSISITSDHGLSAVQTQRLLSTFKTMPCPGQDNHDPRGCAFYHSERDCRRNPYAEYYTVDDTISLIEKMYHPVLFRTIVCQRGKDCPFIKSCSFSHSKADLRDRQENSEQYENYHSLKQKHDLEQARQFGCFLPQEITNQLQDAPNFSAIWEELHIPTKQVFRALNPQQLFLLHNSKGLVAQMQDFAFEQGLARATVVTRGQRSGILLTGMLVEELIQPCLDMLNPPSNHFAVETRDYGERVVENIRNIVKSKPQRLIGSHLSKHVYMEIMSDTTIRLSAVRYKNEPGSKAIQEVLAKLDFWMSQEGYDKFIQCCCCFDERNADEGVQCSNGHFFCSIGSCFDNAIKTQIVNIDSRQEDPLLCPMCDDPYQAQKLAAHLSPDTWEHVQKAIVDQKVEQQRQVLQKEFDERLDKRVQKLLDDYGQAGHALKEDAQREAMTVRNTIMNLACPHCNRAYFDFDGCMALCCASCKRSFCGYCHQKTETSQGAHEHVRQCLMNTTPDASYYASEERKKEAQRQYRTRELKKYLQKFKKNKQNAIVIELAQDLKDLDIKPEALYEVGNLLPEG
ncbi:hypothetical protein ACA910_008100 [Epithemia clementina (nom. ined.)]